MFQDLAIQRTPLNWLDPERAPDMVSEPLKGYRITLSYIKK